MTRLRVATYNLHSGVGVDRRFGPSRIIEVINELHADVVALQEVLSPVRGFDVHAHLGAETGLHLATMTTMPLAGGTFGNGLLTRWPMSSLAEHDLSVGTREPRGAIEATIGRGKRRLRVVATHLGLRAAERHQQLARLLAIVRSAPDQPTVLAGDFNITRARARELREHAAHFGTSTALATFPSIAPMLPLDRIFALSGASIVDISAHRSRRARIASDHLPLVATIELSD
ncbi:MAG TPA: endonuclease/exonuclease/phosphatase family protein [Rhodanobacteraceae bacterium]